MEYTFEEAAKATQPYISALLKKFEDDIRSGVFLGDEAGFLVAKSNIALLATIKTTIFNLAEGE